MSVNIIKVADGSNIVFVFSPATFHSVSLIPSTNIDAAKLSFVLYCSPTQVSGITGTAEFQVIVSSTANGASALNQLYSDLDSYYNQ
jgi:sialic acid synthase SpsE